MAQPKNLDPKKAVATKSYRKKKGAEAAPAPAPVVAAPAIVVTRLRRDQMQPATRAATLAEDRLRYAKRHPNMLTVYGPLYGARTKARSTRGWTAKVA